MRRALVTSALAAVALPSAWCQVSPQASAEVVAAAGGGDHVFRFGLQLLVVGMGAVFLGLLAVFSALILLRKFTSQSTPRAGAGAGEVSAPAAEVTTEVSHAIALALYMDLRTFGEEDAEEITIQKITRPYSPWWNSSKTMTMFDKMEIFRGSDWSRRGGQR